jgi:hypothetical protein
LGRREQEEEFTPTVDDRVPFQRRMTDRFGNKSVACPSVEPKLCEIIERDAIRCQIGG